jgi:release factor glutamine methyltransferase
MSSLPWRRQRSYMRPGTELTVKQAWRTGAEQLRSANIVDPESEARRLLGHVLGLSAAQLVLRWGDELDSSSLAEYRCLTRSRAEGVPYAYLVGKKEFYGREFHVDERVLVPRPETETLVEVALELMKDPQFSETVHHHGVVDLCTGSGAVGLTLAVEHPSLTVYLTDIEEAALEIVRKNAVELGVQSGVYPLQGDLFCALKGQPAAVPTALVTVNPPYVAAGEYRRLEPEIHHEPRTALVGGDSGLELTRRIIAEAPEYLVPGGWLCMEIGAGQHEPVTEQLHADTTYQQVLLRRDLAGIVRVIAARKKKGEVSIP